MGQNPLKRNKTEFNFQNFIYCSKIFFRVLFIVAACSAAETTDVKSKKILFLNQNLCCGYSKDPTQWDGSFEHSKHMLKSMGKKILHFYAQKNVYLNLWTSKNLETLHVTSLDIILSRAWITKALIRLCLDPEGNRGSRPPPEKSQKFRVLAILVRIPWKITKLQSQNSMLGHHFNGFLLAGRWWTCIVVFGLAHQL